ncbi:methyl-accepting chemotaxis protein [Treponema sp. OMZ 840]|uniref:methyl-accepting chemotaxis protein n=1 Tax=Treponema sp. OMZ 840 TaxID=244313 RepID=UPI003D919029
MDHGNGLTEKKAAEKKRFSIRKKLVIVFGILILLAEIGLTVLAVFIAKKAVSEKVEAHLVDKARDTAEIVDAKVTIFLQFLEGLARMPALQDDTLSYPEKIKALLPSAAANDRIVSLNITDRQGRFYTADGKVFPVSDRSYFKSAIAGTPFVSEAYIERDTGTLVNTLAVPIYSGKQIIGVLSVDTPGTRLSDDIDHITVGKTGYCFILGLTGTTLAHRNRDLVLQQDNFQENAKTNPALVSIANFAKKAMEEKIPSVAYYTYNGQGNIGSYATLQTTGWEVVIRAPVEEFMGTVKDLRRSMIFACASLLAVTLIIVYFIAVKMVNPVKVIVEALKNIAQGEGDLTVRLPVAYNDEVTDLSGYFNQTIEKIGISIKSVDNNAEIMQQIGNELASNMTETASAVTEISANIEGVKQQALTQAASVTETAATIEEIIHTIKKLNESIETQAASVSESSSAIEEMVANIGSITQTLEKTDGTIKDLASATSDGKETLLSSSGITQQIAEESGSLLEASSVIQHIASQTNLLAMNAAIEAAHAGEAGKGFAVVADEIRKLAEESSAQGKTITATLKNLSGEIEVLSNASKTVEEKFNIIFTLSEQVKTMSNRLTEAMREQENASKEVLTAIKDINTVTVQVNDGSNEMLKGGEQVAQEMNKLDGLTRIITESMNEMAAGATQINNAVREVSELTVRNKQSIENLTSEVKKFKV